MEVTKMSPRRTASLAVATALAFVSLQASAAVALRVDAQPVADPIQVFVNVTNSSGGPVTGLQAGDFRVLVDGTEVSSPSFSLPPSAGGGNVSVVFAMDMSQTVQNAALAPMQDAVIEFIRSMQNGDFAAIVKFNNTNPARASVVQPFTEIDSGTGETMLEAAVTTPYPGSGSNILDAVALSVDQLASPPVALPDGPRAIVLVSDGRDNASSATLEGVIADANAADTPIFAIGVGDLTTTGGRLLSDLATGTGGQYLAVPDNSEIAAAYRRVASQLSSEYVLTFSSSISDCSSHSLQVQVTGQGSQTTNFQRCTSSGGGGGGGGGDGGGGGGGATTLFDLLLGAGLFGLARCRRRASQSVQPRGSMRPSRS